MRSRLSVSFMAAGCWRLAGRWYLVFGLVFDSRRSCSINSLSISRLPDLLPDRPLLNSLLRVLCEDDSLHVDTGQMHLVGFEFSRFHDVFGFDDGDARRRRQPGIEIPGGLAENKLAPAAGFRGFTQSEIGLQRAL